MVEYHKKFREETEKQAPDVFEARENFEAVAISQSIPIIIAKKKNK